MHGDRVSVTTNLGRGNTASFKGRGFGRRQIDFKAELTIVQVLGQIEIPHICPYRLQVIVSRQSPFVLDSVGHILT